MKNELRQFQIKTKERIVDYLNNPHGNKRYLLADEVGLGKTVVARGVIEELSKDVEELIVYYVCGNLALAKENMNKLMPDNKYNMKFDNQVVKECDRLSMALFSKVYFQCGREYEKLIKLYAILHYLSPWGKNVPGYEFLRGNLKAGCSISDMNRKDGSGRALSVMSTLYNLFFDFDKNLTSRDLVDLLYVFKNDDSIRGDTNKKISKYYDYLIKNLNLEALNSDVTSYVKRINDWISSRENTGSIDLSEVKMDIKSLVSSIEEAMDINSVSIYSLTPKTSVDYIRNNVGKESEKIAAYVLLAKYCEIKEVECPSFVNNKLQNYCKKAPREKRLFHKKIVVFFDKVVCGLLGDEICGIFEDEIEGVNPIQDLKDILEGKNLDTEAERDLNKAIRERMAYYSLKKSGNNTLVVVDEFQNYSELLEADGNENAIVKNQLLGDKTDNKVLLLSATPFKYSTLLAKTNKDDDEISDSNEKDEGENHTELKQINKSVHSVLEYVLEDNYKKWEDINKARNSAIKAGDTKLVEELTRQQENHLYNNGVSRVERQNRDAYIENNIVLPLDDKLFQDMMRLSVDSNTLGVIDDIELGDRIVLIPDKKNKEISLAYIERGNELYTLGGDLEELAMELWNEAETKNGFLGHVYGVGVYVEKHNPSIIIKEVSLGMLKEVPCLYSFTDDYKNVKNFSSKKGYIVDKEQVENYEEITCANARFNKLQEELFSKEMYKLLFVPPTIPHYPLGGVYKNFDIVHNSKGEHFSKTLLFSNYNATPRSITTLLSYNSEQRNVSEAKKNGVEDVEVNNVFADIGKRYGLNIFLDGKIRDAEYYKVHALGHKNESARERYRRENFELIENELVQYKKTLEGLGSYEEYVRHHSDNWEEIELKQEQRRLFGSIIGYFYDFFVKLGGNIDEKHYIPHNLAWWVYKVFTTREAWCILHNLYPDEQYPDYMDKINAYCMDGNIRAVLDEYISLLLEKERIKKLDDMAERSDKAVKIFEELEKHFAQIFSDVGGKLYVRTGVDLQDKIIMESGFAIGHYKDSAKNATDASTLNKKIAQFNSPFRPFVFASTSVGQEGFDFHLYCRKIVHWSLLYDPVRFEQREGRINRYHGLYQRANMAMSYYNKLKNEGGQLTYSLNDWDNIYDSLKLEDSKEAHFGLIPDWYYPKDMFGDEQKYIQLERSCYYYPCSREAEGIKKVMKACSQYRALLGQTDVELCYEDDIEKLGDVDYKKICVDLNPCHKKVTGE